VKYKLCRYNFLASGMCLLLLSGCNSFKKKPTNILLCIADDASYPHMGGECQWVKTPGFDKVAKEGIKFTNAYTPNSKCAPSRSCIITGRNSWQLKEAANHFCYFPQEFKTFPEVLKENGFYVGYTGKGWAPGEPGTVDGKERELVGKAWNNIKTVPPTKGISQIDYAANFEDFLSKKPAGQSFCFWYGGHEPHRNYEYGSSIKAGKKLSDLDSVPNFLPDATEVRTDMLDYALEIEYFDLHLSKMIEILKKNNELENTLIIVTSDNGMPFPRAKSDEYEYSNHMPMAIMWRDFIKNPGRVVDDYVSFIDLSPTILDAAKIPWENSGMQSLTGKSLKPILENKKSKQAFSDFILIGKERHDVGRPDDWGYPIRGIIMDDFLYIMNFRNDLWPAGDPQTGYPTVAGSPTKTKILQLRNDPDTRYFWELSFGKRVREELYDLNNDPDCLKNLAEREEYSSIKSTLSSKMKFELIAQKDPRMFGHGEEFQKYPFSDQRWRNAYNRIVLEKENLVLPWINKSDIDSNFRED
jgi:N-sulfoglucosamine sulfohydrolase